MTITADDIRRGLERRYRDGWVVLHEVPSKMGPMPSAKDDPQGSKRYLDTVAVGMYRSTDYAIVGHEIKVSRADWLSEIRTPEKAGAFDHLVTEFYAVAPAGVVKVEELPNGWGLLVYYPTLMRRVRVARTRTVDIPPSWVASLVGRALAPVCEPPRHEAEVPSAQERYHAMKRVADRCRNAELRAYTEIDRLASLVAEQDERRDELLALGRSISLEEKQS